MIFKPKSMAAVHIIFLFLQALFISSCKEIQITPDEDHSARLRAELPRTTKNTNIEIVSCIEANDTNPLNNLCFTLEKSGKPLIDMVILFSSNINYNEAEDKVYVHHNNNVQHILENKDKYIKPLKDRGIRVMLSILGNHDRAGVANLADGTARQFAQELKATCERYDLDGVFFDDEYSAYQTPAPSGFVNPSSAAASRLLFETKKAMPDKAVLAYVYSLTASLSAVDGMQPGQYVDYGLHDYLGAYDLSSNYPGMPKSRMGLYSQEFARNRYATRDNLKSLRGGGYGTHMIFAMDPMRGNFDNRQLPALQIIANELFDDNVVYNGKPFAKDW